MRLADALAAMPPVAFERLLARRAVSIDPAKRLAPVEQAARGLAVVSPALLSKLPGSASEAIRALTVRPGRATRASLGGGVLPLVEVGLVFPVPDAPDVLAMPTAYRLQMRAPAAEDPRAARALLAAIDAETYKSLALQHLGRPPIAPRPLILGDILSALESSADVERSIASLPRSQQRVLAAVEARGSEASGDELLDLAKEPQRWGPVHALPKSGTLFALLSRGLLLPHGANSYAVPAEVAAVIGRERRAVALRVREDVARRIARSDDDDPARARLADDPGPIAVALLAELSARGELPDGSSPARKSSVRAAAKQVGAHPDRAEVLVALARAAGLASIAEARDRLLATWRASGAWDEARTEPDRLRATEPAASFATPTSALREALLDLLASLPEGRFAPAEAVLRAARADLRCDSADSLLERASRRAPGAFLPSADAILRALLERSLPALGALDRTERGELVRLAAPIRASLRGIPVRARSGRDEPAARWESGARLRLGPEVKASRVEALAPLGHVIPREGHVVLVLDRERIAGLAARGELEPLRAALEKLAPLDRDAARALAVEVRPLVACELVPAAFFLAIPDEAMCASLAEDPTVAPLIARRVEGGLVFREGVARAVVERRLRRVGGVIEASGVAPVNPPRRPRPAT